MAPSGHIEKVAIVGASGRIGQHFVEELLKTGKHEITALTHANSKGILPPSVKTVKVDYDDPTCHSLTSALKGQQFLIITLSVTAPPETHSKLVAAAAAAGVPYIMPNVYGTDIRNERLGAENLYGTATRQRCQEVQDSGAAYVAMVCGFWYEWSLALGEQWFGFDVRNRTVTFFDDGNTRISVSTWRQCGRALAALLSLPESGASPCLAEWKNEPLYIASFLVSQRDMLDSLHRVLGTSDTDWTITHQPTAQRYEEGLAEMKRGIRTGFAKAMYSRVFYPNGDGDHETSRGLVNGVLGLPREDLDEATRRTVEMVVSGWNPFA